MLNPRRGYQDQPCDSAQNRYKHGPNDHFLDISQFLTHALDGLDLGGIVWRYALVIPRYVEIRLLDGVAWDIYINPRDAETFLLTYPWGRCIEANTINANRTEAETRSWTNKPT